ncbi:MAG TPA: SpaA isopeptide-forming pilin-related protein [Acidimicrobiales bacterium]|jgi:uncharacterized repeat protein (TIGR01451 family)|nr:SpaA isopeptide-forming pilin-related protein [Acidimicrobiales bacterium]
MGWFTGRQAGRGADDVRVWERIASHVSMSPARPWRGRRTEAAMPVGAGSEVDDVVARLRPIEPDELEARLAARGAGMPPAGRHSRRSLSPHARRRTRRAVVAVGTAVSLTLGATGALPAAALTVTPGTLPGDNFEQDGNFTKDGTGNTIDWTSSEVEVSVVRDELIPSGGRLWDSAFQGSSKEEDPANWTCQAKEGGVTPGKDNLLRAYVSTRFKEATAFLDLGLVKAEGEGDTHVNFEFNKNGSFVGEALNGSCPITRTDGDFLIAYDFGGTSTLEADVRLFTWGNSKWNEVTSGFAAKAANNIQAIADDPMVPGTQYLEPRTFAEVTLQLPGGFLTCPGFGFANVRSRSSHSITSALQDKMPTTGVDVSTCGDITLHKVDDKGQPLAGAVFGLFKNAQASGTPDQTCTTDAAGICSFPQVTPGSYWVKEIAAPLGYDPDPDIVPVTVTFRSSTTISLPFENPLILGNLLIRKTHSLGGAVPGVRFFLTKLDGTAAVKRDGQPAECTTGEDGTCTITGLVPGDYIVKEDPATIPSTMTQAPDQQVKIEGNKTAQVSFVNPVKPIAITLTKTVNNQKSVTVHQGDGLTYRLSIKNTGQLPLTLTSLVDVANQQPVTLSAECTALIGTTLAVGATADCSYAATASVDVDNKATVVGTDVFKRTATADDTATVDVIKPAITLTKTVNGQESVTLHAGETTRYVITFKNTGDTALRITSLIDKVDGTAITLDPSCAALVNDSWLAPGDSRSCTYTSSAPAGGIANTARVDARDILAGPKGTVWADDTATVKVVDPKITLTKTVNGAKSTLAHEGDEVTYEITFTNNGDTPLIITSLTDVANGTVVDLPAACDNLVNSTPLAVGDSRSCTYKGTAGAVDITNTAKVEGRDTLDPPKSVSASDSAVVDVIKPLISIVKKVNGQDSVKAHAGDPLTYTLAIKNIGDTELTITALTDSLALSDECKALVGQKLAVDQTRTCSYTATAPASDFKNVAKVTGVDVLGTDKGTTRAEDDAFVDVITPGVSIVKKVNGEDAVTVHEGDLLTYTLQITNTGDTPLKVTSLGDKANGTTVVLPSGCTSIIGQWLEVNEARTCTYSTPAGTDDVRNVARVDGEDELGGPKGKVFAEDDARVTVIDPEIQIVKTVNGAESVTVHVGDALTYKLVITNIGDTPLTITSLTDVANEKNVALSKECTDLLGTRLGTRVGVDDSVECTYTATATKVDVVNTATVVGRDDLGGEDDDDDTARVDVLNPEIQIVKTVNEVPDGGIAKVHAGDKLTYELVITNIGDTPLTITSLADVANRQNVNLPPGCTGLVGDRVEVDASVSCTYTTTATTADVTNVATVVGKDDLGGDKGTVDDSDDAKVDVLNPGIEIVKTVNGEDAVKVHAGDALTYRLVITNTGDAPLTITSLSDVANDADVTLPESCTLLVGTSLAVRASVECSYTTTATSEDVHNVAKVEGEDELGGDKGKVNDSDDADVDVLNPAITIVKTVNGKDAVTVHAGDTLTYKLVITNSGDAPLTITGLRDVANSSTVTLPAGCTDLVGDALAVGASVECTYTTTATANDVTNVATVDGEDELKKKVTDDDDAKVDVINPAIQIVKTVNGQDSVKVHAGDTLTYKLVITNTGDTPLTLSALNDVANGAAVTLPAECSSLVGRVLALGASVECTYSTIATAADVTNVASTTGDDELGKKVTDDDDAKVDVLNPAIRIVKTANPTQIQGNSGTATFSYAVTNTGDTTLFNVVVDDDIIGEIGRIARLEVGETVTLTKTSPVSIAQPINIGTATGEDELGKKVTDNDDESITFVAGVVVTPPPPSAPAPAAAPLPRTGAGLAAQVVVGLTLMILGGVAVVPNRRRRLLGSV